MYSHDLQDIIKMVGIVAGVMFQVALWFIFVYYFVISIFGWVKRKEMPAESFDTKHRFALIVAAHNEEAVVAGIVRSLKQMKYPKSMYDIFVIADNCDDNTAKVARDNGAIVYERTDNVKKGKGYSLEWMFKKLFEMDKKYDAIGIFDADNLVSPNFLLEMNKQLCLGHKVIQGYLDSKNPTDSWISGNYSIAYWVANRLFQLPRHYLGLSCALGGTGFVMAVKVLKEMGWGATCLTEDLEFSVKLVLKGMKVSWAHEAIIYDEKPLKLKQSWNQRKRWMQGHNDCAVRFFKALMKKAVSERNMVALDCALYLVQPMITVLNAAVAVVGGIVWLAVSAVSGKVPTFDLMRDVSKMNTFGLVGLVFFALSIVALFVNIVFIFIEGKFTAKLLKYIAVSPIYSLTWIPIIVQGFMHRNRREWVHTLHTRAMDIADIEKLERVG